MIAIRSHTEHVPADMVKLGFVQVWLIVCLIASIEIFPVIFAILYIIGYIYHYVDIMMAVLRNRNMGGVLSFASLQLPLYIIINTIPYFRDRIDAKIQIEHNGIYWDVSFDTMPSVFPLSIK